MHETLILEADVSCAAPNIFAETVAEAVKPEEAFKELNLFCVFIAVAVKPEEAIRSVLEV